MSTEWGDDNERSVGPPETSGTRQGGGRTAGRHGPTSRTYGMMAPTRKAERGQVQE